MDRSPVAFSSRIIGARRAQGADRSLAGTEFGSLYGMYTDGLCLEEEEHVWLWITTICFGCLWSVVCLPNTPNPIAMWGRG